MGLLERVKAHHARQDAEVAADHDLATAAPNDHLGPASWLWLGRTRD
jgi:hypothetical protein